MIADEIRAVLHQRRNTHPEWDDGIDQCWKKEVEILTRDLKDTINFFDNECTADDLYWISEVFDELVEATQSRELIACLYRAAAKYPEESEENYIFRDIKWAEEGYLLD